MSLTNERDLSRINVLELLVERRCTLNTRVQPLAREVKAMPEGNSVFKQQYTFMSLNSFKFEARKFLNLLEEDQGKLLDICRVFTEGKIVWPDQCGYAVAFLHRIDELVQAFCTLLEDPERIPEDAIRDRYPLLMALQNISEEIKELVLLINRFRNTRETSTKQMIKQRQDIQNGFRSLLRCYKEVMDILPDLASFQKK